jgi:hypothetical protein
MAHNTPRNRLAGLSEDELAVADLPTTESPRTVTPPPRDESFHAGNPGLPAVPTAEAVRATSLNALPSLLRELSELEAALRWDWWVAYENYRLCRARSINHYHEYDRLQITAAQFRAEADDDVINAMVESRHRWEAWQAARRARSNVEAELRVRLAGGESSGPS